jgi:hypothetical protein
MSQGHLNFHETFAPEREHLGRLLRLADHMPFLTKEEVFAETGIPTGASSGKVVPHIKYAEYMGLVKTERRQGKFRLEKTPVAEHVTDKDPFLAHPISQLLCHYNLTSKTGAALWHFVIREFLPSHGRSVTRSDVQRSSQARFGKRVNLTPFVSCYTRPNSFGPLGLLRVSADKKTWSFQGHSYQDAFRYLYAYTLLSDWDRHSDEPEITINDVTNGIRWGAAFFWDMDMTLEVLSALQEVGAVKLNRQLEPITIIRTMATEEALRQLYSLVD